MKQHLYIHSSRLTREKMPLWEYHVHTSHTDGTDTVEVLVDEAIRKNISRLIFTEHTEPWQAKKEGWFSQYVNEIEFSRRKHAGKIEIIIGLEAPAIDLNGQLELTDEMIEHVEFVLGAAHRYPALGERRVRDLSPEAALEMEFNTLMALTKSPLVDAIAHIGATCAKYCGPFPLDLTREVVRAATQNNKAIEINHAYHTPLHDYINICMSEHAWIIPGSNVHRKQDLGNVAEAIRNWQDEQQRIFTAH